MHQPYTLVQRARKNGKPVYYARFRGPDGERLPWKSTKQTSKAAARNWADAYLKSGLLPGNEHITLEELSPQVWEWDSEYMRGKRARGGQIGKSYVSIQSANMRNHVLPVLGSKPIVRITRADIDRWQLALYETATLSPRTINHALSALKGVLRYAVDRGILNTSPADPVKKLTGKSHERGVLTPDEARRVLNPSHWKRKDLRLMTYLAATTGMRMGELQAVRVGAVYRDHIDVRESWERGFGFKDGTKWGSKRKVPIGQATREKIEDHIGTLTDNDPQTLLFPGSNPDRPVSPKAISSALYAAMKAAGIGEAERRERKLGFHSWRHFFITRLRAAGLSDGQVRALSGHSTVEMLAVYSHFSVADFAPAAKAIEAEVGAW